MGASARRIDWSLRAFLANPKTAKDAWDTIEAIFQDNKRTRVVALKGELRMIQMGDQTADEYFSNIDSIVTLLNDLGSDVSQDDVVTYAINGLSDKYGGGEGSLAQIIAHKEPFPDLSTVRSMVSTEEMRIRNKSHSLSVSTNSSAPQVLLTETPHRVQDTRTNKERDNRNNNKTEVCRNFGRGVCRWGATYRGLDLAAQQQLLSLLQAQNTLLAQYGLSTISIPRTPIGFNNSGQRIVPAQPSAQQLMTHGLTPNHRLYLPMKFKIQDANIVRSLWLFPALTNVDGSLNRYRRLGLVANGITQIKLDVKNAFLHGSLSETVYMLSTSGFSISVCILIMFAFYNDHFMGLNRPLGPGFSDLQPMLLGDSYTSGIFLSQQKYATEVLERAGMLTCNPCRTPIDMDSKLAAAGDPVSDPTLYRRLAGALQYLTFTRPDISFLSACGRSRTHEFGRTYVVKPKGKHLATIVWLHGLGDNGSSWSQLLETLPLPNIKWICPTSPSQPLTLFGGFPSNAWFDVSSDLSEDAKHDVAGLDASAAHVLSLLSTEPKDVVGLSGWLPCAKELVNKVEGDEAAARASSLPILLCHGKVDDVVLFRYGEKSAGRLTSCGFQDFTFKTYDLYVSFLSL
ncbi:acyl-protein thioesterase 2-like protein [Tanacetum coccineum]